MLRSEHGQNLIELAIAMPLLVLLLTGIGDMGRAFFSYIQITNAAREGARAASRLPCDAGDAAQRGVYANRIVQSTRNEVDGAVVAPGDLTIAINPRPVEDGCQTAGQPIVVTVSYPYVTILSGGSGIASFTMRSSTAMPSVGRSP
jgi:Flp pilus assembly protein TadG